MRLLCLTPPDPKVIMARRVSSPQHARNEHTGSKRAERRGQRAQTVQSLAGLPLQEGEKVSHLGRADLVGETFRHERESHRRQIRNIMALHCILDPFTPAKRHAAGRLSR